jgi:hypothetical protein
MNRRGFLKGAAGLLSLPIVGKMASSVKSPMVREGIANVAQVASDAPIYFWKLVDKIRNLGKDVTQTAGTADRQTVKQYKDYEMTTDNATGQIEIQRVKVAEDMDYYGSPITEEVSMTYRPGEVIDEVKGIKSSPEYEEGTSYLRNDGPNTGSVLDEMSGLPDDIFKEVGEELPEAMRLHKNYQEFRKTKAEGGIISLADGGRVGMFRGGIPKAIGGLTNLAIRLAKGFMKATGKKPNEDEIQKIIVEAAERDIDDAISNADRGLMSQDEFGMNVGGGFKAIGRRIKDINKDILIKEIEEFNLPVRIQEPFDFAAGGRVGRWMGGPLSAGKSTLREMLKYFSKGSTHRKSGAELLKMVNPKQILKYLEDPNDLFMKGASKEGIMATDMFKDYAKQVEGKRSMMIGEILDAAKNVRKGDKSIDQYKQQIIKEMMDKGANREMAENLAEMVSGMAQNAGGRTPTPNITDQGLLELENIQKNLLTKGRSLNADGGRIELAKGGLPRALQLALKTIKSKFGDDAIKNLENEPDYGMNILNDFNIARPEPAVIRDKMKNFGNPGQYNPDGSIDYGHYAEILNDSENIFVYGDESIESLEAMKKERFDYYDDMRGMYDRGELDKYAPSKLDNVNDNQIAEAVENIFPTGDIKLDAEMAAESLVELNPQIFGDVLYADLKPNLQSEIYGAVLEVISSNSAKMREFKKLSKPTNTLASLKAGEGINISDPNIADEFTRFMKESNPKGYEDIEQKIQLESFNPKGKKGNADGGIIGLTSNPRSANNKAGVETLFKRR